MSKTELDATPSDRRPTLTLACGYVWPLSPRELEAWQMLTPEWRWHVTQLSPVSARIVLNATR